MTWSRSQRSTQFTSNVISVLPSLTTTPTVGDELPRDLVQQRSRRRSAEYASGHHPTRQQGAHLRRVSALRNVLTEFDARQFQVVHDPDGVTFRVHQLAIEQVQPGVDEVAAVRLHG